MLHEPLVQARFVSKVNASGDCWHWSASFGTDGYGQFKVNGRMRGAHRVAFELAFGAIPDGLFVLHTCDNRCCVRNDDEGWYEVNGVLHPRRGHLWLGTNQDNMDDMWAKGRANHAFGERVNTARLAPTAVAELRRRHAAGGVTQSALAAEYGICQSAVHYIVAGRNWKVMQ